MKLINWFFNFSKKYSKVEREYSDTSRKIGPVWNFISLALMTAIPLLTLWGAFAISWGGNMWIFKILCIVFAIASIFKVPSELAIFGIVALRHRVNTSIQGKIEGVVTEKVMELDGQELTEEDKQALKSKKVRGAHPKADLIIGILGLVFSVLVVVAFVVMLILFAKHYWGI